MDAEIDEGPDRGDRVEADGWFTTPITALRADGDPSLYYLDGRELYGEADFAELPLPDQLHPDAAAHRRIGERFAERAFGDDGPLAAR